MATQTTLTEDEQAAIFHAQGVKLGAEIAAEWEKSIGSALAPAAHLGAIESFVSALVRLVGAEHALQFLEALAAGIRAAAENVEANNARIADVKGVGAPRA